MQPDVRIRGAQILFAKLKQEKFDACRPHLGDKIFVPERRAKWLLQARKLVETYREIIAELPPEREFQRPALQRDADDLAALVSLEMLRGVRHG